MSLIYRNTCVAAAALARATRKHGGDALLLLSCAVAVGDALAAGAASSPPANTLPTGAQVVAGSAIIKNAGNTMTVNQGSARAAINWNSFSIGGAATVNFVQPASSAIALNRVVGTEQSVIAGALNANGQVFLLNSNGVLFTPGATINTAGLVASTLALSDDDFRSGRYVFSNRGSAASVINQGQINVAPGGYAAFLGRQVSNQGTITARLGTVALAAGDKVSLKFNDGSLINVTVDNPVLNALVENKQAIHADGGQVILTAKAVDALLANVVNNTGEIRAQTIEKREGRIFLLGGSEGGIVSTSGTLDASGRSTSMVEGAGTRGGNITVTGRFVELPDGARIDASGETGGGTVLVGGDFQGSNPGVQNAFRTIVGRDVIINADAISRGNGGTVVVWADDATAFAGSISARGGARGGDGGNVEVSGKGYLAFRGRVDTSAPHGKTGTLLLDPADIVIQDGSGDGDDVDLSIASFAGGPSGITGRIISSDTTPSTLFQSELQGIAATTNISLASTNSIVINDLTDNNLNLAQGAGNSATFSTGAGGFTMLGANDRITTAGGALNITATGGAAIGSLATSGGLITINVGSASTISGDISGTGTALTKSGAGSLTLLGPSTYTGLTTVSAGALRIQDATALGTAAAGTTVASGAALELSGGIAVAAETLTLNGTGVGAAGALRSVSGANSWSGPITLGSASRINSDAGSLTLSGGVTGATFGLTAGGAGSATVSGVIGTTTGTLTKDGPGTLTLQAANTFTGSTSASGGTLTLDSSGTLASSSVIVNTGATLVLDNSAALNGNRIADSATLTLGGGTFRFVGRDAAVATTETIGNLTLASGTFSTVDSVHSTVPGATNTLTFGAATSLTRNAAATVNFVGTNSALDSAANQILFNNTTPALTNGIFPFAIVTGPLNALDFATKSGSNLIATTVYASTIAAAVPTDNVKITAGETVPADKTINSLIINGTGLTVALDPGVTLTDASGALLTGGATNAISGGAALALGAAEGLFFARDGSASLTVGSAITGSGGLTKANVGTLTLSGTNTYTGTTTVNAGTLTLSGGSAIPDNGAVVVAAGANLSLAPASPEVIGSLAGNGSVALGANTLTTGDAGSTTFTGGISGSGALIKQGSGTFTLSGTNTYTGTTTVNAGTLSLANGNAIANTGAVVLADVAGATLNLANSETIGSLAGGGAAGGNVTLGANSLTTGDASNTTFAGVISGVGGALTKQGSGTFTLSGTNTYTGTTTVNAGTLTLSGGSAIADAGAVVLANAAGAALNLANSETIGSLAGGGATGGNVTLGANTLTTGDTSNTTFAGVMSGAGGTLTKQGSGTFTLSGTNTYTGVTTVNAGTLTLASGNAIANTGSIVLADVAGATLSVAIGETIGSLAGGGPVGGNVNLGNNTLVTGDATSTMFAGVMSGAGGRLTKQGSGTFTLSGANTYTGTTTVNAGTLSLAGGSAIADAGAVVLANAAGATLNLANSETVGSLAGGGATGGNVTLGANTLTTGDTSNTTFAGVMSGVGGALTKQGSGTLTLSGANTYTGTTTVNAGTLTLSGGSAIADTGAVVLANAAGATLNLANSETVGSLAGGGATGGNVTLGANTLTTGDASNTTFAGVMSGLGGALTKQGSGTFTLSGANTYTGATTVNAGTLSLAGGSAIADAGAVVLANAAGATLNLANSETVGSLAGGGATGGNVTLGANTLTTGDTSNTTFAGVMSGVGGALTKQGSGTFTLSGANTHTGTTTVNAGTLTLSGGSAIADTGAVVLADVAGATLNLANSETIGSLAGGGASGGNVTLGANTLTTGDASNTTFAGVMSGAGGALTKQGSGTFTLSGTNTYTGTTTVNAGTLSLAGGSAIADAGAVALADVAGATLNIAASETIGSLAGGGATGGNVTLSANTLTTGDASNTTFAGVMSGAGGALTKQGSGTFTLSGANTYTGATTVNAGTLSLAGGSAIADAGAVVLANAAGATLNLANSETIGSLAGGGATGGNVTLGANSLTTGDASNTTFAGVMSGAGGALTKQGSGTFTLSGVNTYTGATTVNAGVLNLQNATAAGAPAGGVAVADGAALELQGGITVGAEALNITGSGAGGNGALRSISGANTWGGAVTLTGAGATIRSDASILTLAGTVEGPGALDLTGVGAVTFGATVGNASALASLTQSATTPLNVNGSLVRTSGNQTYNGPVTTGGAVILRTTAGGDTTATGIVNATAGTLTLDAGTGNASLANAANDFDTVQVTSGNVVSIVDSNAMTLGTASMDTITARTLSGDLTLGGNVNASGSANAIVLAAAGNFNNAGAFALNPGTGRWLVYTSDPATANFGGLSSGNLGLWNRNFVANPPASVTLTGNLYLFNTPQTLTFTSGSLAKTYGDDVTGSLPALFTVSGANTDTYGGAVVADSSVPLASLFSGAPSVVSAGAAQTANVAAPYAVTVGTGTLSSLTGYGTSFDSTGNITVAPKSLTLAPTVASKVYDGNTTATVTGFGLSGFVNAETVIGASTSALFNSKDVLTANTVTISGITLADGLSGGLASNYAVPASATAAASITPKPLTLAPVVASKTYDGTTVATVASYGISGFVNTETLIGASAGALFNSKDVATASTVTISGITLSDGLNGGVTSNYGSVPGSAIVAANITPKPLTLAPTAASKVYDGNTAATVTSYGLSGFVNTETVIGASTSALFNSKDVATANTVTITGISLADGLNGGLAANYSVASSATATAGISRAPLTVTANDASKVFDGLAFSGGNGVVYSGFVGGEASSVLSGTLVYGGTSQGAVAAGSYSIVPGGLTSGNYNIGFSSGLLTVNPTTVTPPAPPITPTVTPPIVAAVSAAVTVASVPPLPVVAPLVAVSPAGLPSEECIPVTAQMPIAIGLGFGAGACVMLAMTPTNDGASRRISMEGVRQVLQAHARAIATQPAVKARARGAGPDEVRVLTGRNAIIGVVHDGVRLPEGLGQDFYIYRSQ